MGISRKLFSVSEVCMLHGMCKGQRGITSLVGGVPLDSREGPQGENMALVGHTKFVCFECKDKKERERKRKMLRRKKGKGMEGEGV